MKKYRGLDDSTKEANVLECADIAARKMFSSLDFSLLDQFTQLSYLNEILCGIAIMPPRSFIYWLYKFLGKSFSFFSFSGWKYYVLCGCLNNKS